MFDGCAADTSYMTTDELEDEKPQSRPSALLFNDEERLFHHLFRHYNNRIRPVRNLSDPLNVALTFSLMQIHHLVSSSSRADAY